MFKSVGSNAI